MKKKDKIYLLGLLIDIASAICLEKSYISIGLFIIMFVIGFTMVLMGYVK